MLFMQLFGVPRDVYHTAFTTRASYVMLSHEETHTPKSWIICVGFNKGTTLAEIQKHVLHTQETDQSSPFFVSGMEIFNNIQEAIADSIIIPLISSNHATSWWSNLNGEFHIKNTDAPPILANAFYSDDHRWNNNNIIINMCTYEHILTRPAATTITGYEPTKKHARHVKHALPYM